MERPVLLLLQSQLHWHSLEIETESSRYQMERDVDANSVRNGLHVESHEHTLSETPPKPSMPSVLSVRFKYCYKVNIIRK